jgi:GT2 family glycosyltransferase
MISSICRNKEFDKGVINLALPIVSVVIVNWDGKHLLRECLDSLIGQQDVTDVEIILVDNGSRDGSVAFVRDIYRNVRVVSLPANIGFAGGSNAGIRIAAGKYIALLNNDTKADPFWLANFLTAAKASPHSVGMWAGKILSYDTPNIIDNVGLLLYPDGLGRGKGRLEKDEGQYDLPGEALFPSGCAGLYRREMLDEIGLFDEEFFAYADDVDIGFRARLAGWGCMYVPSAKIFHKYSSSSSAYSPFKAFLVERNRIWILLKYFPMELIVVSPCFTFLRLLGHLYGALTGKGASGRFSEQNSVMQALTILLKAWGAALKALPSIMKQRRAGYRLRRIRRFAIYRLLCVYRLSTAEISLKD